jgi:hypothetical protein
MVTTAPDGTKYAVFWDAQKRPQIGKFDTVARTWQLFDLSTVASNPLSAPEVGDDTHHNVVVAVDGDGYIHVAANHHDNTLRYLRSTNAGDITAWTKLAMVGTQETSVSYPQFVRLSGGDLLLFYRNGSSGNGDTYLNRYAKSSKTWSRVSQVFSGTTASPTRSSYMNRIVLDSAGTLHLFYLWRISTDPSGNYDVSYIKSTDSGVTWTTAGGSAQTLPIDPTNTAPVVIAGAGYVNQTGASVDSNNVPHACWWITSGGVSDLHHVYYAGGAWHNDVVATYNTASVNRPGCWSDGAGNTFAVYARSGLLYAQKIYPTVGTERQVYPLTVGGWEPTFDVFAGASTMRLLFAPSWTGLSNTYAGVLTVDSSILLAGAPASLIYPRPSDITQSPLLPGQVSGIGGLPMVPGLYYSATGTRDASGVAPAQNEARGAIIASGRACRITNVVVNVVAAGGTGATFKVVITDLSGNVIAATAAQDGTSTGNKNIALDFNLTQGQAVVAAVLNQGSASGTGFSRITSYHDPRVGVSLATGSFTGNNLAGLSATGISGALPATITWTQTANVPLVALYVFS